MQSNVVPAQRILLVYYQHPMQSKDGASVGALQTHGQAKQISSCFKSEHRLFLLFIFCYHPIQLWTLKQDKKMCKNQMYAQK